MTETPREWGNFTSCEIGDGSLVGHTDQEVFMAGVQWGMASAFADKREEFSLIVYPWNVDRVLSMLKSKGATTRCCPCGEFTDVAARF